MVDAPATSRADQTGTGLKGRISQNLQDLIRLKKLGSVRKATFLITEAERSDSDKLA